MKTFLTTLVVLLVLAGLAMGGTSTSNTVVLKDMFTPWSVPIGNNAEFHGYLSERNTLTQSQSTYSDVDWMPWIMSPFYTSSTYNSLDNNTTSQVGIRINGDSNGSFGTDSYSTFSRTASTIWALSSTFYPLEDRLSVNAQSYKMLNTTSSSNLYGWDCRDLINAGLSGGCAGSNQWSSSTTSQMLGGTWTDFDIIGGLFVNFQQGQFTPSSYTYSQAGFDSWPSQPYYPTGTGPTDSGAPEPVTTAMIGSGLMGLSLIARRRRAAR